MAKTIAAFMTETTGNYYSKLGLSEEKGDYITASELSPLFSEIIADWVIGAWEKNGFPNPVQLVDLGPGKGTMMKNMLAYIAKQSPKMYAATRIVLVERSKELEKLQKKTLKNTDKLADASWISDVRDLSDLPFIMIANEFFDCLPIHQMVKTRHGFRERLVQDKNFVISDEDPTYLHMYMAHQHRHAKENEIFELCPYATTIIDFIAQRMATSRSSALVIDYGYEEPQNIETLQAIKNQKFYPVLDTEGDAEITAHVDFSALRSAAIDARAKVYGPLRQGIWLKQMGIEEKARNLIANSPAEKKEEILDIVEKLIGYNKMGNLFKVMSFYSRF